MQPSLSGLPSIPLSQVITPAALIGTGIGATSVAKNTLGRGAATGLATLGTIGGLAGKGYGLYRYMNSGDLDARRAALMQQHRRRNPNITVEEVAATPEWGDIQREQNSRMILPSAIGAIGGMGIGVGIGHGLSNMKQGGIKTARTLGRLLGDVADIYSSDITGGESTQGKRESDEEYKSRRLRRATAATRNNLRGLMGMKRANWQNYAIGAGLGGLAGGAAGYFSGGGNSESEVEKERERRRRAMLGGVAGAGLGVLGGHLLGSTQQPQAPTPPKAPQVPENAALPEDFSFNWTDEDWNNHVSQNPGWQGHDLAAAQSHYLDNLSLPEGFDYDASPAQWRQHHIDNPNSPWRRVHSVLGDIEAGKNPVIAPSTVSDSLRYRGFDHDERGINGVYWHERPIGQAFTGDNLTVDPSRVSTGLGIGMGPDRALDILAHGTYGNVYNATQTAMTAPSTIKAIGNYGVRPVGNLVAPRATQAMADRAASMTASMTPKTLAGKVGTRFIPGVGWALLGADVGSFVADMKGEEAFANDALTYAVQNYNPHVNANGIRGFLNTLISRNYWMPGTSQSVNDYVNSMNVEDYRRFRELWEAHNGKNLATGVRLQAPAATAAEAYRILQDFQQTPEGQRRQQQLNEGMQRVQRENQRFLPPHMINATPGSSIL